LTPHLYTYDEVGNKLTQTDAEQRTTTWTYDYFGRVLTRALPEGMNESFVYDDANRTITHTDFNGDSIVTSLDNEGRVVLVTYLKDSSTESYTYDANGNRETATNSEGSWVYTYDSLNRLDTETQPNGDVLDYDYDVNGNKTQLKVIYASGAERIETYTYDDLNRLKTVTDNDQNVTTYEYDDVGNRAAVVRSNGNSTGYQYDSLNRLTQVQEKRADDSVYQQFDYQLHDTGRREKITELGGRVTDYIYDALYRLTDETIADPINGNYSANYSYDFVGNRTASTIDGVSTVFTYDLNDRLIQQGGEIYTYDDNGNTLSKTIDSDVTTYTYDARQKLVDAQILESGVLRSLSYRYNVDGIRTQKIEEGVVTNYLVDSNRDYAQVIAETDDSDNVTTSYTYGDDLLSMMKSGEIWNYQYDGLGSTRSLTDSSGNESDSYTYDAFGNLLSETGATENSYLFAGEQFESSLDQYYLRARYVDQNTGRFTQMDEYQGVILNPITLQKYLYANADPVNGIDPSGYVTLSELTATMNNIARNTTRAAYNFSKGARRAGGRLMNQIGKKAEDAVERIVKECIKPKKLKKHKKIKGSNRQLDLIASAENAVLNIEVKSKIPKYGSSALRRLKEQLLASQKAGNKVKVVGADKISNKTLEDTIGYLQRAGVDMKGVDIYNGLISFAQWSSEVYFEECLEN